MTNDETSTPQTLNINFSDADHLFLNSDELQGLVVTNSAEATQLIYAINAVKRKLESVKQIQKESNSFYKNVRDGHERTLEFLESKVQGYLETTGENLPSPAGTAFVVEREKVTYPSDDVLIEWSKAHNVPVKVTEKPKKREILDKVKDGVEPPQGLRITSQKSLTVRSND